ncbi:hypothetical protein [Paenibacillus sp. SYP-B4298]|uniref:hypothetical protein n=1 Tax=Paenibacillus sp. SYP-B4298 TaxID=2996034 RepID=UPI0022DE11F3|nr:hypothetical protein [Paenibacillus sp. SYP-B4298]
MQTVKYAEQKLVGCGKKSKPLTVLLAMMCPGAGHLYLGEALRAAWFIILFGTNSLFLLYVIMSVNVLKAPLVIAISVAVFVVYICNIVGSLQQVNLINIMDRLQYFEDNEERCA